MKTYNLIKTRHGHRSGVVVSYFYGTDIEDKKMLNQVEIYLKCWLESYNNSIPFEEIEEMFKNFDSYFSYDVWRFELEEDEEDE